MNLAEVVYVGAGVVLPAYYIPQVTRCAADRTLLASYSMSKAAMQLLLRSAMLPFVYGIGNATMAWVVSLDFAGRAAEFGMALLSLRRQGSSGRDICRRCLPIPWPVRIGGGARADASSSPSSLQPRATDRSGEPS